MHFLNRNGFVKNVGSIFSTKILLYIVGIVSSVYLARILGAEGKGKLAIVTSVYGIALQFGCLGLHTAHTYYISQNKNVIKKCEGNIIFLTMASLIISLLLLPFFIINNKILNLNNFLLIIAFFLIPGNIFTMLQENLFISTGHIKQYNIIEFLNNSLYFIFLLLVSCFVKVSVETVTICMLISITAIDLYSIRVYFTEIAKTIKFSGGFLFEILPYGIKSYCSCLICYLILRADIFMLNYFRDNFEVGIYSLATSLIDLTYMVSSSICIILFPHLGTLKSLKEKLKTLKKVFSVAVPVMIIIYLFLGILCPYVINILYGEQFSEASKITRLLIPGAFCWSSANYFFQFFLSENNFISPLVIPAISLIVNIILNVILIPLHGNVGAAIASTVSYGICFLGMLISLFIYINRCKEKNN